MLKKPEPRAAQESLQVPTKRHWPSRMREKGPLAIAASLGAQLPPIVLLRYPQLFRQRFECRIKQQAVLVDEGQRAAHWQTSVL